MFKNTKRVLAIILAMAVVTMSMFTGVVVGATSEGTVDLLEFGDYLVEAGSASKYWDTVLADEGETGDSWENAIIIDSAEELVYLCKASGDDTIGKYYKVADGIKGFNLATSALDLDGTLADNLDIIKGAGKNHAGNPPGFQGHFDGNGATVYGAWTNHNEGAVSSYAGLFSCTKGEVTIKNIHVNKAHFTAKTAVGGIIGYHAADAMCTVTIENCSVTDSYLETQGTGWGTGVGAIIGFGASAPSFIDTNDTDGDGNTTERIYVNVAYNIKNCYVNLDADNIVSPGTDGTEADGERVCHGGVAGGLSSNALSVSNCVVIGITPYATSESTSFNDVQHSGLASHFNNVYTTSDVAITDVTLGGTLPAQDYTGRIIPLTDAQLKGTAAMDNMNLDWSVWMADSTGYPELRTMHKDVTFVDNGDGTHSETCACGFGGISAAHIWVNNECACGAKLDCAGRETIYWDMDGTLTEISTGSGTKEDPYVIKAASEFAWLIKNGTVDNTKDKYYKIADNIGKIVLQPKELGEEILALKNADEVQAYFENDEYSFTAWPNMGWEQGCFCGIFDGNGATVYGLYQTSTNNAGLFSNVDAGAVIKNIALKNSYLTSSATNYQVGGLAAVTNGKSYARKANGAIWFDSCVVANNYMYNSSTSGDRTGVIIGSSSDMIYIDNCLIYGNKATYGDGVTAAIWSGAQNSQIVSEDTIIPEGLVVADDGAETPRYYNKVRNSIILGTKPYDLSATIGSRFNDPKCYEYVYTDSDIATDVFSNGATMTLSTDQMKQITVAELATLKLGEGWLNTATYPELAVFHDSDLVVTPNNDGTHGSVCSCGTVFTSPCEFVDGACSVCDAKITCATKRTIYWNGAVATGFADSSAGTKEDPIIINSAEELAYLISSKADVSKDKYFEIAEDIGTIVLQPQDFAADIMALNSAADVQAFFENDEYSFAEWPEKAWEASCFAGSFNGNGVKIYGLYIVSDTNAGLFSTVDAGAAIRNVAVLNSYLYSLSSTANYQVGAIAAVTSNGTYGIGEAGVVWFDGCIVGNCYMRNDSSDTTRSGVLFGAASSDSVVVDNCLVYGNDAKHGTDHAYEMSLINTVSNSIVDSARVPAELELKVQVDNNTGVSYCYNMVRNTIAFGTDIMNTNAVRSYRRNDPGCYENNYTDGAAGEVTFSDGNVWTYEESQIKSVTLETLNDNELGDAWVKTTGYPELKAAHLTDVVDNGDGTHSVSCPCGAVAGEAETHTFANGTCSVCGTACEHIAGEPVEENRTEPSCTGDGSYDTVVYCTVCGGEISRDTIVLPGGHKSGEAIKENEVEATCTVPASYDLVVYCTECEEEISRETITGETDPDKHNYVGDTCKDCGAAKPIIAGDADGNGVLNTKDAALIMQYINGWDVEVHTAEADYNGDGVINTKDYVLIIRYLNGWTI